MELLSDYEKPEKPEKPSSSCSVKPVKSYKKPTTSISQQPAKPSFYRNPLNTVDVLNVMNMKPPLYHKSSSSVDLPPILDRIPSKKSQELPRITAKSWVLFEASTSKYLYGKFPNYKREIASLTKIMTLYTALLIISRLELDIKDICLTVTREAYILGGTTAELIEGDLISIEDLCYGLMLPSGNDAAYTIGEYFGVFLYMEQIGRGEKVKELEDINIKKDFGNIRDPMRYFISEMNDIAERLNLSQTIFNNSHGMSSKINISSAFDVALLTCTVVKNPDVLKICQTQAYIAKVWRKDRGYKELYWENTNKLLDQGFEGVKTGITPNAGPCLSAYYKLDKGDYIDNYVVIVVLSCDDVEDRFNDVKKIASWCKSLNYK